MIIKEDGTVDCVTSFEELERVKALVPTLIVRDLNGKHIPGILELNTETMDALMYIRVEDNLFLHAKDMFGKIYPVKVRVCLEGCSISSLVLDVNSDTYKGTETLLDSKLMPISEIKLKDFDLQSVKEEAAQ